MKKTNYSSMRSKLAGDIVKNKNELAKLAIKRKELNQGTADFIVMADKYYAIGKEFDTIISGLNKTNLKKRIELVIDRVINRHVPNSIKSKFSRLKKDLEQFSKLTGLDIKKVKDKIVNDAKIKIDNGVLDEAERMYYKYYRDVGFTKIKHVYSKNEIAKWLRKNRSSENLKKFKEKLSVAAGVVDTITGIIKKTEYAVSVFDCYSRGKDLVHQQKKLKTAKDYKDHYYRIALEASRLASQLKGLSGKLPPGMRDYYEFIFTVAENTDKMANVVFVYVSKLEKEMDELDKDIQRIQKSKSVKAGDYRNMQEKNVNRAGIQQLVDILHWTQDRNKK